MKYLVITVTEGGAEFDYYYTAKEVVTQFLTIDRLSDIEKLIPGDYYSLNGCSQLIVVNEVN